MNLIFKACPSDSETTLTAGLVSHELLHRQKTCNTLTVCLGATLSTVISHIHVCRVHSDCVCACLCSASSLQDARAMCRQPTSPTHLPRYTPHPHRFAIYPIFIANPNSCRALSVTHTQIKLSHNLQWPTNKWAERRVHLWSSVRHPRGVCMYMCFRGSQNCRWIGNWVRRPPSYHVNWLCSEKLWNSLTYCKSILNKIHVHLKFKRDYTSIRYPANNQICVCVAEAALRLTTKKDMWAWEWV